MYYVDLPIARLELGYHLSTSLETTKQNVANGFSGCLSDCTQIDNHCSNKMGDGIGILKAHNHQKVFHPSGMSFICYQNYAFVFFISRNNYGIYLPQERI